MCLQHAQMPPPSTAICPSHEAIFQNLAHLRPGTSVCSALQSNGAGFVGSDAESRTRRWWRLHELLGGEATFTDSHAAGAPDAAFHWLNETVPLAHFGLRRDLFAFMTRHKTATDPAALHIARRTNSVIHDTLLPLSNPDPPWLGLGNMRGLKWEPSMNGCRHTMMLVLLLHAIPEAERRAGMHVLEVGGGYGNMARMALLAGAETVNVRRWTVFDMRQSTLVQEWFLRNTLHRPGATNNVTIRSTREIGSQSGDAISAFFDSVQEPQVTLVDTSYFHSWASAAFLPVSTSASHAHSNLIAIGTHSWSELPWETFCQYFNAIAGRAQYILYATQQNWPSTALTRRKLAMFRRLYEAIHEVPFENGNTLNVVFRLKRPS